MDLSPAAGPVPGREPDLDSEPDADHPGLPGFPRRPVLVPGVRVVRRSAGEWQVGCDPGRRVVLPATPAAEAFLSALTHARRPRLEADGPRRWAEALLRAGLVVEAAALARVRPTTLPPHAVTAAFARHGAAAGARLRTRAAARVVVDADAADVRDELDRLLAEAGLRSGAHLAAGGARLVVRTTGEPDRDETDPWMRGGVPHLLLTHRSGRLTVGPFVVPGLTACLRCVDAHHSDHDPGHGLVVEQHGPDPSDRPDPVLLSMALAWAVRDLVAYAEGDLPASWSSVVEIDAALTLARRRLARHPRCGCSWGEVLAAG